MVIHTVSAVLFFEMRITLEALTFDDSDAMEGLLRIHLRYTIRTTNTRHNMVYPLYLDEGRGSRAGLEGAAA